ncbi:hypothetical protein [Sporosarcina sp. A2]|uniref:hypothetical protein n=1 Tax=Sporosarcina sp. A2 TaxID=3393449 RepID=UPI003D7B128E
MANPSVSKITLTGSIASGTFNVTRPVEFDLAGNNIGGTLNFAYNQVGTSKITSASPATVATVNVNTPNGSFVQGSNVTITTLNLINVASATYTNNGTITNAVITDTDARFLNEGAVSTLTVNSNGFVTLGGSSALSNVVVTKASSVNVAAGTNITTLEVNGDTTVNNAGTIADVTGSAAVTVIGNGEVKKSTNTNVTVPTNGPANVIVNELTGLTSAEGVYSASFHWGSSNGIGTKLVEKPDRYSYFNDGTFFEITVKNADGANLVFNDVFQDFALVSDAGNRDSLKGTSSGRQFEDWNGTNVVGETNFATKLKTGDSNAVFYGVRQTGKTTATGMTRTTGFKANTARKVDVEMTPLAELAPGEYTVTFQAKQQTGVTSSKNLDNVKMIYTFTK